MDDIIVYCDQAYATNIDYHDDAGWDFGNGLRASHKWGEKLYELLDTFEDEDDEDGDI